MRAMMVRARRLLPPTHGVIGSAGDTGESRLDVKMWFPR